MTVLTNGPRGYWYVLGSVAIVLLVASTIWAQGPSYFRPVIGIQHDAVEPEDSCVSSVSISVGQSATSQTETQPKPHLPVSAITKAVGDVSDEGESGARPSAARFEPIKKFEFEKPADSFRPNEDSKAPSRFLKPDADDTAQNGVSEKFHWKRAVLQSLAIQSVQHAYAIAVQERMRRELKGPFLKDWFRSVRNLHGWEDGNRFFTNYIAHPMQGGMTGFIFLQNHDRLKRQKFGESKTYWIDRLKAMAWSAAWSTQWEIGPYSQASIGNVGLKKGMAYVDLVITPTVGTGWMVTEEAFDRYLIRHIESENFILKIFARTLLNPMRAVANALRFREPWYRDRQRGH